MSTFANAIFKVESWEEEPIHEVEGATKLTRVSAIVSYRGDLEGEGRVEYLMSYRADGSTTFLGMERITGGLAGYEGSFVLQHVGTFSEGAAKSAFSVIPGSGSGKLEKLRGHGEYASTGCETPITFQFDIDGVEEGRETALAAAVPA